MTYKEALEELQGYADLERDSETLLEDIKELESKNQNPKSQVIDDMPRGSSKNADLSSYLVTKEKLEERRKEKLRKMESIDSKIYLVSDTMLSNILRMRYIKYATWEEIGEVYNRSRSWALGKNPDAVKAYMSV